MLQVLVKIPQPLDLPLPVLSTQPRRKAMEQYHLLVRHLGVTPGRYLSASRWPYWCRWPLKNHINKQVCSLHFYKKIITGIFTFPRNRVIVNVFVSIHHMRELAQVFQKSVLSYCHVLHLQQTLFTNPAPQNNIVLCLIKKTDAERFFVTLVWER